MKCQNKRSDPIYFNLDLCIGCGVCATGCPEEAIDLVEREEILVPPVDQKALSEAFKKADQAG